MKCEKLLALGDWQIERKIGVDLVRAIDLGKKKKKKKEGGYWVTCSAANGGLNSPT